MKPKSLPVLLALLMVAGVCTASEKPWIEVKSPHFRVLTDSGEGDGRLVAREFEDFRALMAIVHPNFRLESGAPLLIFAARDQETAKALNPNLWKKDEKYSGYYSHSWEKQFALLRLDTWGRGSQQNVFYDYAQMMLALNCRWIPTWVSVGFDEFYSYTKFEEDRAIMGAPSLRLALLKNLHRAPIPLEVMLDVNGRSSYMHEYDEVYRFRAEAWLLYHYLVLGPDMEGGKKFEQFFGMLQEGADQKTAFQQVFGSYKSVDAGLQKYLERFTLPAVTLKNPQRFSDKDFVARTMTLAETQAELGGYHLWTRDWDNARAYVKDALVNDPNLGLAHEEQGFLNLHDGKNDEAVHEFSSALEKDKTLFLSQFFKTMLAPSATSDVRADQSVFRQGLTDTLNLNLQFAPAFVQLSLLALRQNDLKTALNYSTRAESLEPSRAGYHIYTAQLLLRMGRYAEAAERARFVAERWTAVDHNEAFELWNSIPEAQRPTGGPIVEDRPKDAERAEGSLKAATCGDRTQWSLTVSQGDQAMSFRQADKFRWGYSDIFWYGQNHISICHGLEGKRTIVFYKRSPEGSTSGEALEVEVRNDLPPVLKLPAD
jgi:Tfp pilus assembly protein PilF